MQKHTIAALKSSIINIFKMRKERKNIKPTNLDIM